MPPDPLRDSDPFQRRSDVTPENHVRRYGLRTVLGNGGEQVVCLTSTRQRMDGRRNRGGGVDVGSGNGDWITRSGDENESCKKNDSRRVSCTNPEAE